jgi:hypothetical protein
LEQIAGFGVPLENVFILAPDSGTPGAIVVWYPEVGLRSILIEQDDLYTACYDFLRAAGVRRFRTWEELGEAQEREKWEGWDTCADRRRFQQRADEIAEEGSRPNATA